MQYGTNRDTPVVCTVVCASVCVCV